MKIHKLVLFFSLVAIIFISGCIDRYEPPQIPPTVNLEPNEVPIKCYKHAIVLDYNSLLSAYANKGGEQELTFSEVNISHLNSEYLSAQIKIDELWIQDYKDFEKYSSKEFLPKTTIRLNDIFLNGSNKFDIAFIEFTAYALRNCPTCNLAIHYYDAVKIPNVSCVLSKPSPIISKESAVEWFGTYYPALNTKGDGINNVINVTQLNDSYRITAWGILEGNFTAYSVDIAKNGEVGKEKKLEIDELEYTTGGIKRICKTGLIPIISQTFNEEWAAKFPGTLGETYGALTAPRKTIVHYREEGLSLWVQLDSRYYYGSRIQGSGRRIERFLNLKALDRKCNFVSTTAGHTGDTLIWHSGALISRYDKLWNKTELDKYMLNFSFYKDNTAKFAVVRAG